MESHDYLISFLFWIGICWGMTAILVQSEILDRIRNWLIINISFLGYMMSCYQCMGFWAGGFFSQVFNMYPISRLTDFVFIDSTFTFFIFWGIISSGIVFIIRNFISKN